MWLVIIIRRFCVWLMADVIVAGLSPFLNRPASFPLRLLLIILASLLCIWLFLVAVSQYLSYRESMPSHYYLDYY
jgi:hypothetical protein